MPNGVLVEPYYIFEYAPWANIVALTKDNEVVLTRQFRPGSGQTSFELPGGGVETADSSAHAAIQRELLEETGFRCDTIYETGIVYPNPANHTNEVHCFISLGATQESYQHLDATEDIQVFLTPLQDLLGTIEAGEIVFQALYITSLFFAQAYIKRNQLERAQQT